MKLKFVIAALFAGSCLPAFGQTDLLTDTATKVLDHHVGVQVNSLVKQVFNFSNSSAAINNPYVITYNINHRSTGWGLRMGAGYTSSTSLTNDGINTRKSEINEMKLRVGVEHAFKLTGKWSAGIGADFLYNTDDDNTNATTISSDTIHTDTETKLKSKGGGLMGWLRYDITKNIVIGTEASAYFLKGTTTQSVTVTATDFIGNPTYFRSDSQDNDMQQFSFNLPVAIYLMLKF